MAWGIEEKTKQIEDIKELKNFAKLWMGIGLFFLVFWAINLYHPLMNAQNAAQTMAYGLVSLVLAYQLLTTKKIFELEVKLRDKGVL